jgi:predicted transcriptional regulator
LANNTVPAIEIPALIERVYKSLSGLGTDTPAPSNNSERPQPAVPIRKSVMPDYIICLEDGKKLKMLKRHLKTAYSMTPEQYRERWGLPSDYPMVAPNYAKTRSRLAKDIGLGTGKTEKKK